MGIHRARFAFGPVILAGLALLGLASCDHARSDLFEHARDENASGWIGVYPEPTNPPPTSPVKVLVSVSERFNDWRLFYGIDDPAVPPTSLKWRPYDPVKGIIVAKSARLSVCAYNDEGIASRVSTWDYTLNFAGDPIVYVAQDAIAGGSGLDPDSPLASIQAGIDLARSIVDDNGGPVEVHVQTGDYYESIVTKPGVRLIGSYDVNFDPGIGYPPTSIVHAVNAASSIGSNPPYDSSPGYGLRVPAIAGSTEETRVESLMIYGPDAATVGAAVVVEGKNARFYHCDFLGGGVEVRGGFWVRPGGSAQVGDCLSTGSNIAGTGRATFGAVVMDGAIELTNMTLRAGSLEGSMGVGLTYAALFCAQMSGTAQASVSGGTITSGGEDADLCAGIVLSGGTLTVEAVNTLTSGEAQFGAHPVSCGILLSEGPTGAPAKATIANNTAAITASYTGSTVDSVSAGIYIGNGVNAVISGNGPIIGGPGYLSAGVLFRGSGGSMRLIDNDIVRGADGTMVNSVGVAIITQGMLSGPIVVARNRIWSGSGNARAGVSVELDAEPQWPVLIRDNAISGGQGGTNSVGVNFHGNVVNPAACAILFNNDIFSGSASSAAGVHLNDNTRPIFINNIIYGANGGTSGGFVVGTGYQLPRDFRNNAVYCGTGSFIYNGASLTADQMLAYNMTWNRLNLDPSGIFAGGTLPTNYSDFSNYYFAFGIADIFFREGGLVLENFFPGIPSLNGEWPDLNSRDRTVPWSVGAVEYLP